MKIEITYFPGIPVEYQGRTKELFADFLLESQEDVVNMKFLYEIASTLGINYVMEEHDPVGFFIMNFMPLWSQKTLFVHALFVKRGHRQRETLRTVENYIVHSCKSNELKSIHFSTKRSPDGFTRIFTRKVVLDSVVMRMDVCA